jgi:hypothetical protein
VIVTMRSKMEYALERDEKTGKNVVRKLGLAPIQRQGMEYEFTIVGDMDTDHNLVVTKSRMETMADRVVNKPDAKFFKTILDWLNSGAPAAQPDKAPAPAEEPTPEPVKNKPVPVEPTSSVEWYMLDSKGKMYDEMPTNELMFHKRGLADKSDPKSAEKLAYVNKILAARNGGAAK